MTVAVLKLGPYGWLYLTRMTYHQKSNPSCGHKSRIAGTTKKLHVKLKPMGSKVSLFLGYGLFSSWIVTFKLQFSSNKMYFYDCKSMLCIRNLLWINMYHMLMQ